MNFTFFKGEIYLIIGNHPGETLGNIADFEG